MIATAPAYVRTRADGWPMCPGCNEDELWSNAVPPTVDTIVSCLRCGWKPGYYEITVQGRRALREALKGRGELVDAEAAILAARTEQATRRAM